jgi:SAM-dependent methyltransferase
MIDILCPLDKSSLRRIDSVYHCDYCNKRYPVVEGVVKLIQQDDNFYEGAYKNTIKYIPKKELGIFLLPLWVVSNGYVWFTRKYVPKGSKVLELGCASGVRYFGTRYEMIGLDLSFSSLKNIEEVYSYKIQANASEIIPLPDSSVDAVISSYFWEHIEEKDKEKILKEIYRVLKPDGKIVFLFDVETKNPLINKIKKKYPEFYKKAFLEIDGHFGYQLPDKNIDLISRNAFKVLYIFGMEKTFLQSPSVYTKLSRLPAFNGKFYKIINSITLLTLKPYLAFLRLIDTAVRKILPDEWSRIFLIVAQK